MLLNLKIESQTMYNFTSIKDDITFIYIYLGTSKIWKLKYIWQTITSSSLRGVCGRELSF